MGIENINRITLSGGLAKDPELRRGNGGRPLMTLRLAYLKPRGGSGARQTETQYVDVVCRGPLAVKVARDLRRGSRIYVDGKLDLCERADRPTGRSRQIHRVDAGADPTSVLYLSPRPLGPGRVP